MEFQSVRDAYSSRSDQYIDLFDGDWEPDDDDRTFLRRHLSDLAGPVLDLGCGPGYWTAFLHGLGVQVTGIDIVPEFIAHARTCHPGPEFRLGSMTGTNAPDHSLTGILSWYSTIHLPPERLGVALVEFRRLLEPTGTLVVGFFDSDDGVVAFDHAVTTAWRWPADVVVRHLVDAGFVEIERLQRQSEDRPDRKYAAVAARAT